MKERNHNDVVVMFKSLVIQSLYNLSDDELEYQILDRWLKKSGKNYYGYKNHVSVDVKNKLIRGYNVTDASEHNSQVFGNVLQEENKSRDVYADSAYRSEGILEMLRKPWARPSKPDDCTSQQADPRGKA